MAWALKVKTGNYLTTPVPLKYDPVNPIRYKVKVKDNLSDTRARYVDKGRHGTLRWWNNTNLGFSFDNASALLVNVSTTISSINTDNFIIECGWDGVIVYLSVTNADTLATHTITTSYNVTPVYSGFSYALNINRSQDTVDFQMEYCEADFNGVSYVWDASASDHSGSTDQPVLTDTVAANNATGVNFPSFDPSVWIDLGGGAITVNDTTATTKANSNSDSILPVGAFNVLDNTTSTNTKSNSDFIQLAAVVSINDSLTTSKSSSNADVIVNVGAFNILDSTVTTKTKSNQDSIQFGAAVFVSDSTATSKSKSNTDSVSLVGQFFISDSTTTSKSNAGSDLVYLSSTVSISDSITTTKTNANNDSVLLVGEFSFSDTVATTKSNSNNDSVSLVGEFIVLDSTATTKTDNNHDGVIIGEIVVSFNPETNYTQLFLSTNYTQPDLSRNYSQVFLSTNYSQ